MKASNIKEVMANRTKGEIEDEDGVDCKLLKLARAVGTGFMARRLKFSGQCAATSAASIRPALSTPSHLHLRVDGRSLTHLDRQHDAHLPTTQDSPC